MRLILSLFTLILISSASSQAFEQFQREAITCFKKQDYACTEKNLRKALKKEPGHPRAATAWSDLGTALRRMGKPDEALKAYEQGLAIAPEDIGILSNRASLKRVMEDYEGSLADYNEMIRLDPDNSDAYMERSGTKGRMGDMEGEEADLTKAVEVDPFNFKASTNLAILKKRAGRYDEALADLNKIIKHHPDEVIPYNNRADLIMTMGGDLDEAMKDINHAVKMDPSYGNGFITRAEIWLAMGNKTEARADLEHAVSLGESREEFKDLFAQCE